MPSWDSPYSFGDDKYKIYIVYILDGRSTDFFFPINNPVVVLHFGLSYCISVPSTTVVTRTRLPEREGNEIEIHGTWIQYRCVRPGTVDLGYYYDTREIGNLDTVF